MHEAVNTGRLVAFVGSGLSLVYGQPIWREFIKSLRGNLEAAIGAADTDDKMSPAEAGQMRAMAQIADSKDSDSLITIELIRRAVSEGSHIGYQRAVEVATRQLISLKTH